MSNFQFLQNEWPKFLDQAKTIEEHVNAEPRYSCFMARHLLEQTVNWMYEFDIDLADEDPYQTNLGALVHEVAFKRIVDQEVWYKIKAIIREGNIAVHDSKKVSQKTALHITKELFHVLYWFYRTYSKDETLQDAQFNEAHIAQSAQKDDIKKQRVQELQDELEERDQMLEARKQQLEQSKLELEELRTKVKESKERNEQIPDNHDYDEAATRDYFINAMLEEAGWDLSNPDAIEYEVEGMPNDKGIGYVDYVLWGDDGLPLGLVEAKRTKKDPRIGRKQARLYADCLEEMTGQRPIIFYTNGFQTHIWDDYFYNPRRVQGFYKKDELQRLIWRRENRKSLEDASGDKQIAGRYYQQEAIQSVTEELEQNKRKLLLVMATGTGKTRVSIAITDLLRKHNWAKNVLFLADRNALLSQAANAFKTHLPNSNPLDITKVDDDDEQSRLVMSTYPTMMNIIDETNEGERRFTPGHFDLIIIDEAHRSIYHKYRAIFQYFDSLLLGLTATPKDEIDRNTYGMFDVEQGVPTYAYELSEGVADEFLRGPKQKEVELKFMTEGITYSELSEEEQEEYEVKFYDPETGEVPEHIDASALNTWLFNQDTVDKMLKNLMEHGQKVKGGDQIGKTIIFAKNHDHAMFIQERFEKAYPHLDGFAEVIDNYHSYAQDAIDRFSEKNKKPHIAISVDMMDTGIDVPEIVNLVFFKPVRSKTKFNQMIGRGTRLCPDLFGPGDDKEYFTILDFCRNFEFFEENPEGAPSSQQESLTKRLFKNRLFLATTLAKEPWNEEPQLIKLRTDTLDTLHNRVSMMNEYNFLVRPHRKYLHKFKERARWNNLSKNDQLELIEHLADLPSEVDTDDEYAKRFDLLILNLQLSLLEDDPSIERQMNRVKYLASKLENKLNIPQVKQQEATIKELQTDEFWEEVNLPRLENVRECLRTLINFIDKDDKKEVYTNFTDTVGSVRENETGQFREISELKQYRLKVEQYIKQHQNHMTIHKLKKNKPITDKDIEALEEMLFNSDVAESKERFEESYKRIEGLGPFIRSLVGLDKQAVNKAFADYLQNGNFASHQIRFVKKVIDYLTNKGTMDPEQLYEPPFTDEHYEGVDGVFPNEAANIVSIIREINQNAVA
jgi:type I restriction enzyme R subunit